MIQSKKSKTRNLLTTILLPPPPSYTLPLHLQQKIIVKLHLLPPELDMHCRRPVSFPADVCILTQSPSRQMNPQVLSSAADRRQVDPLDIYSAADFLLLPKTDTSSSPPRDIEASHAHVLKLLSSGKKILSLHSQKSYPSPSPRFRCTSRCPTLDPDHCQTQLNPILLLPLTQMFFARSLCHLCGHISHSR